jgi:N-acetyl-anhydromuramyl-L-alanine amidase AmpD
MALNRIWIASPNYSSRGGANVRLLVVHTAEGSRTIESLGSFFANPSSQVSSHTGADDKPNTVGEYVSRPNKAWTQGNANPVAASIELCGVAAWSTAEWENQHPTMLANCAAWLAEEAAAFGVPLVKLSPADAQGNGRGVCAHSDLGAWGGNHSDPGNGFPWARVMAEAGGQPSPGPTPPQPGAPAPPWPGVYLRDYTEHPSARTWQAQMSARGWSLAVDGMYGPQSDRVCTQFQAEKGLQVDGVVGPVTWAATWEAPIT